ncbi:hypothetical protein MUP77_03450 [Candidatus Bathyarchaeota archaeon]|nr:hypothetical protein [Candidatus Bathyarchaeota archaeon]
MSSGVSPSVLQILEKYNGKRVRVVLERSFGFEGVVAAVSQDPPGLWISDSEAVVIRTTLANPVPQVVGREDMSEIFINLNSVQRIEVLH